MISVTLARTGLLLCIMSSLTAKPQTGTTKPLPCKCGPDFCLNDARYPEILSSKKNAMAKAGYPAELIALMDYDGACVARLERAPVSFSMKLVRSSGSATTMGWSLDDERIARKELMDGTLKAFYEFNTSKAFSCCDQITFDQRTDWNPDLELNLDIAIACTKAGAAVACKRGRK